LRIAGCGRGLCSAPSPAAAPALADKGDAASSSAREAFRNGERVRLGRQVEALQGHPLQPWAEYWALRLRLDDGDASGVADYLNRHPDAYLAEKLRGDWLRVLGKNGDWEAFQRERPALALPDAEVNCYAAQAARTPDSGAPAVDQRPGSAAGLRNTGGPTGGGR
jgi:soluble lytic murein transglycosylase